MQRCESGNSWSLREKGFSWHEKMSHARRSRALCPVCLARLSGEAAVVTPCPQGHRFHEACWNELQRSEMSAMSRSTCPTCRGVVSADFRPSHERVGDELIEDLWASSPQFRTVTGLINDIVAFVQAHPDQLPKLIHLFLLLSFNESRQALRFSERDTRMIMDSHEIFPSFLFFSSEVTQRQLDGLEAWLREFLRTL